MSNLFLKEKEWSSKARAEVPVRAIGKFLEGEKQATELIQSGKYGLTPSDFWVLKTSSKDNSVIYYTAVCMTHIGCMKVNDSLPIELRYDPSAVEGPFDESYNEGLNMYYKSPKQGIWEVAEVCKANLQNGSYPYAMLSKRLFDRVVLRLSKLAFSGIAENSGPVDSNEEEPTVANYDPVAPAAALAAPASEPTIPTTPAASVEAPVLTIPTNKTEALSLIMPAGTHKGKTLGMVLGENPGYAKFWVGKALADPENEFCRKYPAVIEACKLLVS